MKMNRRNALIGLGAIATGGGALFGSGAFSSVSADREVTLSVAGDSGANMKLEVDPNGSHTGVTDGGPNGPNGAQIIKIDVTGVNDKASTTFNGALRVTNNGDTSVDISISSAPDGFTFTVNTVTLATNGDSTLIDMTVDTTSSISGGTITIEANPT